MTRQVFLHVGLPKSGTSYLQKLFSANRDALLRDAGVLFPGVAWSDQVAAVRDVRSLGDPRTRSRLEGSWQRLVDEVLAGRGNAVISMEWLCAAGDGQIERIVGSFDDREVRVVFTARDLARTLPAAWQEFMQNRQTWTWEEFLHGVREPESTTTGGGAFWSQQHLPRLLERWGGHVRTDHLHVVTLPQPGADRDLLWQRFAGLLGIDPGVCATHDLGGNESLGLESAELMRRLNLALQGSGLSRGSYHTFFKHRLAKDLLAARRPQESTLTLSPEDHAWISEVAERHIELVAASGVGVVGDLAELRPAAPRPGRGPGELSDSELLEVALDALVRLGVDDKARQAELAAALASSRTGPVAGLLARVRRRLSGHG